MALQLHTMLKHPHFATIVFVATNSYHSLHSATTSLLGDTYGIHMKHREGRGNGLNSEPLKFTARAGGFHNFPIRDLLQFICEEGSTSDARWIGA